MGWWRQPQPFPPPEQGSGLGHPSVTPGRAGIQRCRIGWSHRCLPALAPSGSTPMSVNPLRGRGREGGCTASNASHPGSRNRGLAAGAESDGCRVPRRGRTGQGSHAWARHARGRIQAGTPAWDSPGCSCSASPIAAECAACESTRGELAFHKVCVQIKQMAKVFTLALMLEVLRLSSFLAKLRPNSGWEHRF